MQLAERAEAKLVKRLEVLRKLNAKREWVNQSLFKLLTRPDLYVIAYERIKSEPGNMTPGTDEETLDGFSMNEINKIVREMQTEKYQCKPVRTTYIPKANGKLRKLGIPCTRDKVVQEAVRLILEAVYDSPYGSFFKDSSHGFRRNRSAHSALEDVQKKWSATTWIVEGDIQNCFDDIDHEILIKILREKISDERFINLICKILKAGYQDLNGIRNDSLAGTPQGGIVSPMLANIYLHKLDEFVEQMQTELVKGGKRAHNKPYKRLQDRLQYWAKRGQQRTRWYREMSARLRKLPSMDPQDPNFVRIRYVRYADDWMIGVIGPQSLAEEIKQKVADFLKSELKLTLSQAKTKITQTRRQEAKFLGYRIRLGRTDKEQKQALVTNKLGKTTKKRVTGMEMVMKAPMDELVKRLHIKGYCDKLGNPVHKAAWQEWDEDQLVMHYSGVNRGLQQYYRPSDNWARVQRLQYILKFSLAKTLAGKRKGKVSDVIEDKDIIVRVERNGTIKEVKFYQNHDWTNQRSAFVVSREKVDQVILLMRRRTRSKLGMPCCICGEADDVQMHHVRHVRKVGAKKPKGFQKVLMLMNRKQIPVCTRCHQEIHAGNYDGLSLKDFAYDPRAAEATKRPPIKKVKPKSWKDTKEKTPATS